MVTASYCCEIGKNACDEGVSIPLIRCGGILIGGIPGSGKSNCVHLLIAQFLRSVGSQIYLIDPKRVELRWWRRVATRFGVSQTEAIALLDEVIATMDSRYQELEQLGERDYAKQLNPILVVVEEVAALLKGPEAKGIEVRLRQLLMLGRAASILVVIVAQRPGVDTLVSSIRDLAEIRIAFRSSTSDMSDVILGRGAAASGADASKIPADRRGVGYLSTGSGEPFLFRAYYVSDERLAALQRGPTEGVSF
ncbi:FtsK/SpoIIIE domain-containing protein [Ferrimicrobium sp.]|uniref:FtsK/SpoIIIE domain-containing protein n=1 Tax=Ferrimicrobium sp. TaxID=2926050 RepID=UPI0026036D51|nr:FtsK/SpoIIIE domain-containing protein [Ferrimicrobium sp.]